MKSSIKSLVKKVVPSFLFPIIGGWKERRKDTLIEKCEDNYRKALEKLRNKQPIKCVFLVVSDSAWKYDGVYKRMITDPRFEPVILACPIVNNGRKNMLNRLEECYSYFQSKGYNVIKSYNVNNDTYLDLRKQLSPDILFYTNPYEGLIDEKYYITNYLDILTVYVGYYFNETADYNLACNQLLHNLVWRRYVETDEIKGYSLEYSKNKGKNAVVTGYPGIENLIYHDNKTDDKCWKISDRNIKRIIWAPHHTIEAVGPVYYSCFLKYSDFMVQIAKKYRDKVQFVFKPHPLLKIRLYKVWGKEKTDEYYRQWSEMPNTAYKEGDYFDLFITSDAMIHDSGSFLVEYLYVNKPVMRPINDVPLDKLYNKLGLKCLDNYYLAKSEEDIEEFVQNVINGNDPLKESRTEFVNNVLMPNNPPSQNIIDDIIRSVEEQIVYP